MFLKIFSETAVHIHTIFCIHMYGGDLRLHFNRRPHSRFKQLLEGREGAVRALDLLDPAVLMGKDLDLGERVLAGDMSRTRRATGVVDQEGDAVDDHFLLLLVIRDLRSDLQCLVLVEPLRLHRGLLDVDHLLVGGRADLERLEGVHLDCRGLLGLHEAVGAGLARSKDADQKAESNARDDTNVGGLTLHGSILVLS